MKNGGDAFPMASNGDFYPGMYLRDFVSAQIMASVMSNAQGLGTVSKEERTKILSDVAMICFDAADAWLAMRGENV